MHTRRLANPGGGSAVSISVLQVRKLRQGKQLSSGRWADKWQSWGLTSGGGILTLVTFKVILPRGPRDGVWGQWSREGHLPTVWLLLRAGHAGLFTHCPPWLSTLQEAKTVTWSQNQREHHAGETGALAYGFRLSLPLYTSMSRNEASAEPPEGVTCSPCTSEPHLIFCKGSLGNHTYISL